FFLAVVEHIGYTGVIQQRRVLRFGAETTQEVGVPGVFFFENFDGDNAAEHCVACFPHFTHSADGDTIGQFVSAAYRHSRYWSHCSITASTIVLRFVAVSWLPTE